jgi:phosphoribosylanthranilate isomerase
MSARVAVKICGVTRAEDAARAAELGAAYVGLNFWPGSRRHVTVEQARAITAALPEGVLRVGVFVIAPAAHVTAVAREVGLDLVQFHGDETPEACAQLELRWLRALRVGSATDLEALAHYPGADAILLDTPSAGYGGSGRTFDWTLAARAVAMSSRPVILAGGLTPENVAAAVTTVRPYAVDVAGGVEAAPGVKDPDKMRRFIENATRGDPC